MSFKTLSVILGLAVAFWETGVPSAHAGGLKWEETQVSLKALPQDRQAETTFVFTNTTSQPLKFGRISTSCGCTSAKLAKKIYQPGESGSLHVVFKFEGRKGDQVKAILVRTDQGKPDQLVFRVEIPDRSGNRPADEAKTE